MEPVIFREDALSGLTTAATCQEKLAVVHNALSHRCPGVDRVSIALYDRSTSNVKTFLASPAGENPLNNYEAALSESSSLADVARSAETRVVNDLDVFNNSDREHSRAIRGHGFASSYTHPMYHAGELMGFVFCNSMHKRYFRDRVLEQVEVFVHLVSAMVMVDLAAARALVGAMRTSVSLVQVHDLETANHLERMSRYARLIARVLAKQGLEPLDDEQIEQLTLFAPLHDVGKIGISERILRKPGKLDSDERQVMNSHTLVGRRIVDALIANFGFEQLPYIDSLRHIAEHHHEAMDGSGYPHGLRGVEIPLEARIIAVSDIFDALTTRRPYKEAWTIEHAFAMLQLLAIDKLDRNCVDALVNSEKEVARIQSRFAEGDQSQASEACRLSDVPVSANLPSA